MEQIVIYGAGNSGKSAYYFLKNQGEFKCLFFVDGDENKWGTEIDGLPVKSPDCLKDLHPIRILVASIYWKEIIKTLKASGWPEVSVYRPCIDHYEECQNEIAEELNKRTIDLGAFVKTQKEVVCKEMTFIPGGSGILDYVFLKSLARKYECRTYLEIGTYIGESINIMTDCCDRLYSITAPKNEKYSMSSWCRDKNLPDYTERLAYDKKIVHFYSDSRQFDFSTIQDPVDLYFIDGDHSYEGVYTDTKNVFDTKTENAIVVWHDFRSDELRYIKDVVNGVKDALGDKFKNVYVTNNNLCGVYLPDSCIKDFSMRELKYGVDEELYTYDIKLVNCQIR